METQQLERPDAGLNPHFRAKIPGMIETLSQVILAVRPHLDEAEVVSGQFSDHHQFELDKARLALAMLNWESKVDPDVLEKAGQRHSDLLSQQLVVGAPAMMKQSLDRIEKLKTILTDLLEAG